MAETTREEVEKRKRLRSPAYPYINLEAAVRRAKEFFDREGRNPANLRVACKHWGYEEKSSAGLQTAAALISFGLMQDEGTGDKRRVQLTPTGLRILLDTDPSSKAKADALRQAALAPKIHQELWNKWGNAQPSDLSMRNELTLDRDPPFNENSVDGFIREYKDTLSYAQLTGPEGEADTRGAEASEQISETKSELQVGDFVQWAPNGILQFREAKRLVRLSPDSKFAFVDGSPTGLPIHELSKERSDQNTSSGIRKAETRHNAKTSELREDIFSLPEGHVTIQWPTPLSAESIADLTDWFGLLNRKISRASPKQIDEDKRQD